MSAVLPVIDRAVLAEQLAGDAEFLLRLVELFTDDTVRMLDVIRDGIARADVATLQRTAHRLKGSCAVIGAPAALDAARRLERAGQGGDVGVAADAAAHLEDELQRLRCALRSFNVV